MTGARLTDATVMHKAPRSLRFGRDPILCCGNLGLKEVKREKRGEEAGGESDSRKRDKEEPIIIIQVCVISKKKKNCLEIPAPRVQFSAGQNSAGGGGCIPTHSTGLVIEI